MVIVISVTHSTACLLLSVHQCLNWKKANGKAYNKAFRAALDERRDQMDSMMNQEHPTREALENAADAIQEAHNNAMQKTVPIAKIN